MVRPRTPSNILALKGAFKKDPQRLKARENEPVNKNPIGKPPRFLSAVEKRAFNEIVKFSIDGVLGEADRLGIEMAARLLVKCRNVEEPASAAEQNLLYKYLSQFGFLAADRSKLSIPAPKKKNKFDDDFDDVEFSRKRKVFSKGKWIEHEFPPQKTIDDDW